MSNCSTEIIKMGLRLNFMVIRIIGWGLAGGTTFLSGGNDAYGENDLDEVSGFDRGILIKSQ